MANMMSGNWIDVRPGDPAFNVLTNMCNYFELGISSGEDVWLEGQIVKGEFVFNGRLYLKNGAHGTLIDSFPKGPVQQGWTQRRKLDVDGYELLDEQGEVIFGFHVDGNICVIDVNLYKANGDLAAHGGQGGIVSYVPIKLGRNGTHTG